MFPILPAAICNNTLVFSHVVNAGVNLVTTATAVDLNGTLNVSGVATFQAAPVFPDGSLAVADLDIDGATDAEEQCSLMDGIEFSQED